MTDWNEILAAVSVALSGDKERGHQLLAGSIVRSSLTSGSAKSGRSIAGAIHGIQPS